MSYRLDDFPRELEAVFPVPGTILTAVQLDGSPRSLLRLLGEPELTFEISGQQKRDLPMLHAGAVHQVLASLRASGSSLVVVVPNHSSLRSDAPALQGLRERILLMHADRVIGKGRVDLTDQARGLGFGESNDLATSHLISELNTNLNLDTPTNALFSTLPQVVRNSLGGIVRRLGVQLPALEDDPILPKMSLFVKEALDNVRLHAVRSVSDDTLLPGQSCVSVRVTRFSECVRSGAIAGGAPDAWEQGLSAILGKRVETDCEILEIAISDCGDGIPATMKESLDTYRKPHVFEIKAIEDALRPKSTRPRTRPTVTPRSNKGFGFSQMLEALSDLRGQLVIWTGRTHMKWSSIDSNGHRYPAGHASKSMHAWDYEMTERVTGTSLSCAIPLDRRHPAQADSLFDV